MNPRLSAPAPTGAYATLGQLDDPGNVGVARLPGTDERFPSLIRKGNVIALGIAISFQGFDPANDKVAVDPFNGLEGLEILQVVAGVLTPDGLRHVRLHRESVGHPAQGNDMVEKVLLKLAREGFGFRGQCLANLGIFL